ncbi:molybdopterin guanine dinucleotide synthesis [Ostreiculturibacter nitratireducens]|uniref:molybdopterin guanine dinucleotide synthesis n=1 Tax=Ostreiculturibacter nitratireducens TaxID=3075226 RepID=UPI0031B63CEC
MSFDTIIVVDWSGGNDRGTKPKKDAIWAALLRRDKTEPPRYFRNRQLAVGWLRETFEAELAAGRRVFAGFDFPFGYPDGFAARVMGRADPLALWDWFATAIEDGPQRNNRFEVAGRLNAMFPGTGPYWFNCLRQEIPGLPRRKTGWGGHGLAERRMCERAAPGAFGCWQMGGAGAVGSQVMTGMAALSRLRERFPGKIAVWPFEPLDRPIALVEVWPSLYAEAVLAASGPDEIRDAAQVRVLADIIAGLRDEGTLDRILADVPDDVRAEEGWIFGLASDRTARAGAERIFAPPENERWEELAC